MSDNQNKHKNVVSADIFNTQCQECGNADHITYSVWSKLALYKASNEDSLLSRTASFNKCYQFYLHLQTTNLSGWDVWTSWSMSSSSAWTFGQGSQACIQNNRKQTTIKAQQSIKTKLSLLDQEIHQKKGSNMYNQT